VVTHRVSELLTISGSENFSSDSLLSLHFSQDLNLVQSSLRRSLVARDLWIERNAPGGADKNWKILFTSRPATKSSPSPYRLGYSGIFLSVPFSNVFSPFEFYEPDDLPTERLAIPRVEIRARKNRRLIESRGSVQTQRETLAVTHTLQKYILFCAS